MIVVLAAAEISRKCLSIKKGSIRSKLVVGSVWKISQSVWFNALVGSFQNYKDVSIKEIVHRMCDRPDDCFEKDGVFLRPIALEINTHVTSNDTQDKSSRNLSYVRGVASTELHKLLALAIKKLRSDYWTYVKKIKRWRRRGDEGICISGSNECRTTKRNFYFG